MRSTDLAAFKRRLTKPEAAAFAAFLKRGIRNEAEAIVALIDQAVAEPSGIAASDTDCGGNMRQIVLAVCDAKKSKVTIGLAQLSGSRAKLAWTWPEFAKWHKQVDRNAEAAAVWAARGRDDCPTFALPGAPPAETKTDEEAKLVARIVEDPDDEALRLVLADLWLERGDPRGRLVSEPDAGDLHDKLRAQIARGVSDHATHYAIDRGFVCSVTMTAASFARHGERMFRAEPIRQLVLHPVDDEALKKLAATPHLALVRDLRFACIPRESAPVFAHFATAKLARLERVGVDYSYIDVAKITAPKLVDITLGDADVTPKGMFELLRSTAATLEVLDASRRPYVDKRDFAKAFAIDLPKLHTLNARGTAVTASLAGWLAHLPALTSLTIDAPGLAGARAIGTHRTLEGLTVFATPSPEETAALLASKTLRALTIYDDSEPAQLEAIAKLLLALPKTHPLKFASIGEGRAADRVRKRFRG